MKIRGMKQALHWLFLAVGLVSVLALVHSELTYLGYAEDGYGLRASVADAWLNGDSLSVRLKVENPGGLAIRLGGPAIGGNLTLGQEYPVSLDSALIKADNATVVVLHTALDLSPEDLEIIRNTGYTNLVIRLEMYVPERDLLTRLTIDAGRVEVSPDAP